MAGGYLIGIDGGTQSSKVVVYDLEGSVVSEATQPLRPTARPRPGVVEHPDDDLWESIATASREAIARLPGDPAC
jgi:sugar (pentulose or hexulose) kinase